MAERRRYTKREKADAVATATATSTLAASEGSGIPESTLRGWMHHPRFAGVRETARQKVMEGAPLLALVIQEALMRAVLDGTLEPQHLPTTYGIAVDKAQLLSGAATGRTEHRDLTDRLPDHEKQALADAIDAFYGSRTGKPDDGPGEVDAPVGVGAAVRQ